MQETENKSIFLSDRWGLLYANVIKEKKMQSQKKIPTTLGTTVTASTGTNKNRNTE